MIPPDDTITGHWDQQIKIFSDNLQLLRSRPGKKANHDLRVSVKKLRSYLRLVEPIISDSWKEKFSDVKKMFRVLGRHRDLEMSLLLLQQFQKSGQPALPSFRKHLKNTLSITRSWVKTAVADYENKKLLSLSGSIHSLRLIKDDRPQVDLIIKQAEEKFLAVGVLKKEFRKNAHEIRKLLKDIYYSMKICPPGTLLNKTEMTRLDSVLDHLGYWQDLFVFSEKLKRFRKEYLVKKTKEYDAALQLEKYCITRKEEMLSQAAAVLEELMPGK